MTIELFEGLADIVFEMLDIPTIEENSRIRAADLYISSAISIMGLPPVAKKLRKQSLIVAEQLGLYNQTDTVPQVFFEELSRKIIMSQNGTMAEVMSVDEIEALHSFLISEKGSDPIFGDMSFSAGISHAQTSALNSFYKTAEGRNIEENLPYIIRTRQTLVNEALTELVRSLNSKDTPLRS